MEFQKHKIIPIASDLRRIHHIFYTSAPDIVHEAVGHIPFLTHPVFSQFLFTYAETVLKSISSQEDLEKYKAIRDLSDLKENPKTRLTQIKKQERKLKQIIKNISHVSEASYLSRLIWWTSEYGLMGDFKNPKIYGAGLISSIGEFLHVKKIKKLRLSLKCIEYPFDITNFQPQLFVAKDFEHILDILGTLSKKLAFNKGGTYGVQQALRSKTVNTVVLDSGLQISGILENSFFNNRYVNFLKFKGPVQLCYKNKQLKGHGINYHKEGYSSPLNTLNSSSKNMFLWNQKDILKIGLKKNKKANLIFKGGIYLKGEFVSELRVDKKLLLLKFRNCLITDSKNNLLYHPSWGMFDLAVGSKVVSVFSGPADFKAYNLKDDFKPSQVAVKKFTKKQLYRHLLYKKIKQVKIQNQVISLLKEIKKQKNNWLLLLELFQIVKNKEDLKKQVLSDLNSLKNVKIQGNSVITMGKRFYKI